MKFNSKITSLLSRFELAPSTRQEAGDCLSYFDRLSDEQRKTNLAATIEKIFPLIFADEAAIRTSAGYQDLHRKPWSEEAFLSPAVIATPSSAQQVSKVLALCRFLGATFSTRGGGHLSNPGFSSNDGGVVICLSKFREVSLSEDRQFADIGVGLTWYDVYQELDHYDVAVTGGRMPTVGVPGLLLGGGLSFHNCEHGFSCSNVVNYEVVLADSTVVNANKKENPDLFWALKGGCCNFGIVTGLKMSTLSNQIWCESRLYSASENDRLIKALMLYHDAIEKNNKAALYYHSVADVTLIVFFYTEHVGSAPSAFECFSDIPYRKQAMPAGNKRLFDVCQGIAKVVSTEKKIHEMRMMSSLPDLELYQTVERLRIQKEEELKDVQGLSLCMSIQPIGPSAMRATIAKGGSPMSIPTKNHQWLLTMADWKDPKDTVRVREACREICDAADSIARKNGTDLPFIYANYASRDQNPLAGYGSEALARLKEIAEKYDPQGVFQTLQNGGWLLSKA